MRRLRKLGRLALWSPKRWKFQETLQVLSVVLSLFTCRIVFSHVQEQLQKAQTYFAKVLCAIQNIVQNIVQNIDIFVFVKHALESTY